MKIILKNYVDECLGDSHLSFQIKSNLSYLKLSRTDIDSVIVKELMNLVDKISFIELDLEADDIFSILEFLNALQGMKKSELKKALKKINNVEFETRDIVKNIEKWLFESGWKREEVESNISYYLKGDMRYYNLKEFTKLIKIYDSFVV